jgi:hypothetical protein
MRQVKLFVVAGRMGLGEGWTDLKYYAEIIFRTNLEGRVLMPNNQTILQWDGDVLNRKEIALFLEKLVLKKIESGRVSPNANALCFALDGDWGTGKTFFVKNWIKDLRNSDYPVIHFDAWINDLTDDPLVGFMAYLKLELEPLIDIMPLAHEIKLEAKDRFAQVMKQAGKAVIPTTGIILKGLIKRYAGVSPDDFSNIEGKDESDNEESFQDLAVDKFFQESLQNHTDKMEAIGALKNSIEHLLEYLKERIQYQLPLFIFIDELDRCRPDYAIRLLEGIKHLFDAKNVCFVVSTNMTQLSESVKAVYGSGFEAYRYLKRFFAFEYSLSEPDYDAFALMLVNDSILASTTLHVCSGLPEESPRDQDKTKIIATNFAIVAKAFNMDLRSQQQCFRSAEAAIAALDSEPFYCFYMFFLVALSHYNKSYFEQVVKSPSIALNLEQGQCHFIDANIAYSCIIQDRNNGGFGQRKEERIIKVSDVFKKYIEMANKSIKQIFAMSIETRVSTRC